MLEFTCPTCGKRVQADDSFAGKQVLCPGCSATIAIQQPPHGSISPATAIAVSESAATGNITLPGSEGDGSFCQEPPQPEPLPEIRKEVPRITSRNLRTLIVVFVLVGVIGIALTVIRKVQEAAERTQSSNNLKTIGLAFHAFHDANRCLPTNGTRPAVQMDWTTGSWGWQILPYVVPDLNTASRRPDFSVAVYMCPGRDRPPRCSTGPWTDYAINPWLNDPVWGSPKAADGKLTLIGITDGASNTLFIGHARINTARYTSMEPFKQSTDIRRGGDAALARHSAFNQLDNAHDDTSLTWGSPFPQGSLMAMGDATVRLFPYEITGGLVMNGTAITSDPARCGEFGHRPNGLAPFLTASGGEAICLPAAD